MSEIIKKYGQITFNIIVVLLIGVATFLIIFTREKIGYIDNKILLTKTEIGIQAQLNLQTKLNEYQAEVEKKKQEILVLQNLLEKSAEKKIIEEEIADKLDEYQTYVDEVNTNMQQIEAEVMQPVYNAINIVLAEFGNKSGYYLILGATDSSNIVFGKKMADLTDELIEYINSNEIELETESVD